jgi:SNF2 family DNA or RNA helicase
MAQQLTLEFSKNERRKKGKILYPSLFSDSFSMEIVYYDKRVAEVVISKDRLIDGENYLRKHLNYVENRDKKILIKNEELTKLLWTVGDVVINFDPITSSVAKGVWGMELKLKPLIIDRIDRRIIAYSYKWPGSIKVKDAPWKAVEILLYLGYQFKIKERVKKSVIKKLAKSDYHIGTATLAGSSIYIDTNRPDLLESLNISALSYRSMPGTGKYRMPLIGSKDLLDMPSIKLSNSLIKAIKKSNGKVKLLNTPKNFKRELYDFQSRDGGKAKRILEITGGVLLAGDMGSGKTTISLALTEELMGYPLLIIAPIAAFSTWKEHLNEIGVSNYLAINKKEVDWDEIASKKHKAIIVSYDRINLFSDLIERLNFKTIIVDEIQRIRNPGSIRSKNIRELASIVQYRIGLSGTPLTNTIKDLLPVGAFLIPNEWSARSNKSDLSSLYPGNPEIAISEHLGKIMVRRRMSEVGRTLPKRNDRRIYVGLSREQEDAIRELQAISKSDKEKGYFKGRDGKMHAFARLALMQKITNSPKSALLKGENVKVESALDLAEDFISIGRKGVIFTADLFSFKEICTGLKERGIGYVTIKGSVSPSERIENEKKFKNDPKVKVVVATIQAGGESWSASPVATWLISTAYLYSPSALAQMEARVYRMNSDPDGPDIEICYIHAKSAYGTLDDRMLEILEKKKKLFAKVIDQTDYRDKTEKHYSTAELLYLILGDK